MEDPATTQWLDEFDATFFTLGGAECDPILSRCEAPFSVFAQKVSDPVRSFESDAGLGGAVRMLNDLCRIYEEYNNVPAELCMEFIDHSHAALVHHPCKSTSARPDIIAVPISVARSWHHNHHDEHSSSVSWHHVAAVAHIRLESDTEPLLKDCQRSLVALNLARPNLLGCFAMAIYRTGFQILWGDPSMSLMSADTPWSDPGLVVYILGFVHFLYSPFAVDPTIRLDTSSQSNGRAEVMHSRPPVWLINDENGGTYRSRTVLSVGAPGPNAFSHRNWVASASEYRASGAPTFLPCERKVIKDCWPLSDDESTWEGAILRHVHADGYFPGVVDLLSVSPVPTDVRGSTDAVLPRNKHRLILDGTGQDLYSCTSVTDFLMVMYDVLEVLKRLHEKYGILHRDISIGNILRCSASNKSSTRASSTFAGDILTSKYPHISAGPRCTLIDFDYAFWKGRSPESGLKDTVGTRPFVSRAIGRRFKISPTTTPPPIAPLTGNARECYISARGEQAYENASASDPHVDLLDERDVRPDRAHFNPHHDAESCYWVILHFLITALPVGIDIPPPSVARLCRLFDMPEFDAISDLREPFFEIRSWSWPQTLQGSLQDLGPFLSKLSDVIYPVYEFCDPPPREYHLHDAMQRIILEEICRILDNDCDVQLNVAARVFRRSAHIPSPPSPLAPSPRQSKNCKKRSGGELHGCDDARRRRLR